MNTKQKIAIAAIILITCLLGVLVLVVGKSKPAGDEPGSHGEHSEATGHADAEHHGAAKPESGHEHAEGHGDKEHHEEGPAKGSRGGQLFTEGDFGLEIVLAEEGGGARFLVYLSNKGKPLPPTAAKVSVTLTRPDGEKQEIAFAADKDALKSTTPIPEPHVFEATIAAQSGNEPFLFTFSQQEGKIALTDAQLKAGGVTIQTAAAARIQSSQQLPGEIKFNEDRTAHVVPKTAGVVEAVQANLGQQVKKGQVLAVISSSAVSEQRSELLTAQQRLNLARSTYLREKKLWEEKISAQQDYLQAEQLLREAEIALRNAQQKLNTLGAGAVAKGALNRYELRAPFDGMVVEKHITLGEAVKEDANVFTISDLSTVWAEIVVPAKDLNIVRVGETATVKATALDSSASGKVSYVSALVGEQTRTAKARIVLPNPKGAWRPGLFVNVDIVSDEAEVPVAVSTDAIQSVNDQAVVFIRVPDGFLAQPVTTGRSNGKQIEIVKGLKPGTHYAAAGSFVIKSEQGKGSAAHSH